MKNKAFSKEKYKDLICFIGKHEIKLFRKYYKDLLMIYFDLEKRIILEGENYLLKNNYFREYFVLDHRMQLGMFIRANYVYNKPIASICSDIYSPEHLKTQNAEMVSHYLLVGYIYYINNLFKIFE